MYVDVKHVLLISTILANPASILCMYVPADLPSVPEFTFIIEKSPMFDRAGTIMP